MSKMPRQPTSIPRDTDVRGESLANAGELAALALAKAGAVEEPAWPVVALLAGEVLAPAVAVSDVLPMVMVPGGPLDVAVTVHGQFVIVRVSPAVAV